MSNSPLPPPHEHMWHLLDETFEGHNEGLHVPTRFRGATVNQCFAVSVAPPNMSSANTLLHSPAGLELLTPATTPPQGYSPGGFPRGAVFNRNLFHLAPNPSMPVIPVECSVSGFDPDVTPIFWRLQCLHLLCRYMNKGNYRYASLCERLQGEWQGRSFAHAFRLFDPMDHAIRYDYGGRSTERLMGGHAILSVAVRVPGMATPLIDYAHLRIAGTNPSISDVGAFIDHAFEGRNVNIKRMIRAVFAHESKCRQFAKGPQTGVHFTFKKKHHQNHANQPDCEVVFDWPDDPAHFPLAAFDFGIGISQYTRLPSQTITPGIVWDWRENIKKGINLFFGKLSSKYHPGDTWFQWAMRAWAAYNGSGPQAQAYANTLAASEEGSQVSHDPAPGLESLQADLAHLSELGAPSPAPSWPP